MNCGVCCGTEALHTPFHGIDHYCTTAHFSMSSNVDLGSLISDNIFVNRTERTIVHLRQSTSTIVSVPVALCVPKSKYQVTPSLMVWRLPFLRAECTGFCSWAEPPPSPSSSPTSPVPYSRQRGRSERRVLVLVGAKYQIDRSRSLLSARSFQRLFLSNLRLDSHGVACALDYLTWTG
jgi:hypothetical protein